MEQGCKCIDFIDRSRRERRREDVERAHSLKFALSDFNGGPVDHGGEDNTDDR